MECIIVFRGMFCQDECMKKKSEHELGQAIELFSMTYQQIAGRLNRQLDAYGLNMTQISILTHFARIRDSSHTVSELADIMSMNQPGVTKAVNTLVKKSLLNKQRDENDGRVSHLTLTSEGLAALRKAQQGCLPLLERTFGELSEEDLKLFAGTLRALLSKID